MAARLSRATLGRVPDGAGPLVRPWDVRPGIVHLGVGAFHRAHQAVYTECALAGGGDWGIVGVAPRRRAVADGLAAQDGLFSVTSLDGNGSGTRVVGSIVGVRHLPSDPAGVVDLIADPAIRIVTLTVTEKGYLLDPATGRLLVHDGLRAELAGSAPPSSIPGLLVAGLRARAGRDAGPLALVSCDNLPSNGQRLRQAVLDAYSAAGAHAGWVESNVSFPGTMVDRVVPATTAETIATAAAAGESVRPCGDALFRHRRGCRAGVDIRARSRAIPGPPHRGGRHRSALGAAEVGTANRGRRDAVLGRRARSLDRRARRTWSGRPGIHH